MTTTSPPGGGPAAPSGDCPAWIVVAAAEGNSTHTNRTAALRRILFGAKRMNVWQRFGITPVQPYTSLEIGPQNAAFPSAQAAIR